MNHVFKLVLGVVASVCGLYVMAESKSRSYISPTPGELPIVATSPYIEWEKPSLEDFVGVKDCGFNCVINSSILDVEATLNLCGEVGLKAIISHGRDTPEHFLNLVEKYKHNKALGAWSLKDEPGYGLWHPEDESIPKDERKYNLLQLYKDVEKNDSNHIVYINQSAGADKFNIGPNKTFIEYLQEFNKAFEPSLWSFDVYPIRDQNGEIYVNYKWFYESLIDFAAISKESNRPFWAYCLSQGYTMPQRKLIRPLPTLGMLRFEAFTALAMGAKGIVYWTYTQRKDMKDTHFLGAPIDMYGNRTDIWSLVQQVNKEMRALQDVFLSTEQVDFAIIGNEAFGESQTKSSFGPVSAIKTQAPGILISELRNSKVKYLMVVNQNPTSSQTIEMRIDGKAKVVGCQGSYHLSRVKKKYEWSVTLEPGGCLILRY
jgi:hypothetical protein